MTVSAQTLAFEYAANGVTTTFPYGFRVLYADQVKVYVNGTLQVGGYTLTGVGDAGGGNVVFTIAPLNGSTVLVRRISDRVRTTDFQQAPYFTQEELLDQDQDYQTMLLQEAAADATNSLRIPAIETTTTLLPDAATRANKAVVFDALGNVTVSNDNYEDQAAAAAASAAAALASENAAEASAIAAEASADRVDLGALDDAVAATAADRVQTGLDAAATAADRVQTGLDVIAAEDALAATELVRDEVLTIDGFWPSVAAAIGNGVAGAASIVAGSGGTNGTFALGFSGGTQVVAPQGYFVVSGGALVQVVLTYPGYYSAGTPTLVFTASAGLTGASAVAAMAPNTSNTDIFYVIQSFGLGFDVYKNVAGVAVYQRTEPYGSADTATQIQLLERSALVTTQNPLTPLFSINSIDALLSDGRNIPNRQSATAPDENILGFTTGDIRSASGGTTVTPLYANGPAGGLTATRIEFPLDSSQFVWYTGVTPPAGSYTMTYKIRLNVGTGSKTMRYGNGTIGYLTVVVTDAAWVTVTHSFTASGANYTSLSLLPQVGSAPVDLLIDEVQFYGVDGRSVPAFTAKVPAWHFKNTAAAFIGRITRSGFVIENGAAGGCGQVRASTFPTPKTFTEVSALVAFKYETGANGQMLVTETNTLLGTTANTFQIGVAAAGTIVGAPVNAGTTNVNILGQGWQIVAIRLKNNNRQLFFHEVELNSTTTAFAGFMARVLRIGGQTTGSPMKGKWSHVEVWDSYLSDADIYQAVQSLRDRLSLIGETMGTFRNFYIAEGDSRTAVASTGYAYLVSNAGEFTPNLYMRNFAVSGSGIATLNARLAAVQRVSAQAQMNGRRAIVSCWIGINDASSLVSGGATNYYNNSLKPIWAAYRSTGAKLIVMTELGDNGATVGYDAERLALNTLIRSDATLYDALADFGSDPVMGISNARTADPTNWTDDIHPNAAGHLLLKPYIRAAIASLLI